MHSASMLMNKMLMREIKELGKGRDISCSWMEKLKIIEIPILPGQVNSFNTIPVKGSVR